MRVICLSPAHARFSHHSLLNDCATWTLEQAKLRKEAYLNATYRAFLHDVTTAILKRRPCWFPKKVPLGTELFSYVKTSFCSNKLA